LKAKRSLTEVIEHICKTKFIASAEIGDNYVSEALGDYRSLNTMHQQGFAAEGITSAQGVRRLKERFSSNCRSPISSFP